MFGFTIFHDIHEIHCIVSYVTELGSLMEIILCRECLIWGGGAMACDPTKLGSSKKRLTGGYMQKASAVV